MLTAHMENPMREFALLFRMDITSPDAQPTPTQMKRYMTQWTAWLDSIDAAGSRLQGGNHFSPEGTVLSKGGIRSKGPYVAGQASVAGYILIETGTLEEALAIACRCPILENDSASVEVRETATPG